jgi:hypothetical protein
MKCHIPHTPRTALSGTQLFYTRGTQVSTLKVLNSMFAKDCNMRANCIHLIQTYFTLRKSPIRYNNYNIYFPCVKMES